MLHSVFNTHLNPNFDVDSDAIPTSLYFLCHSFYSSNMFSMHNTWLLDRRWSTAIELWCVFAQYSPSLSSSSSLLSSGVFILFSHPALAKQLLGHIEAINNPLMVCLYSDSECGKALKKKLPLMRNKYWCGHTGFRSHQTVCRYHICKSWWECVIFGANRAHKDETDKKIKNIRLRHL